MTGQRVAHAFDRSRDHSAEDALGDLRCDEMERHEQNVAERERDREEERQRRNAAAVAAKEASNNAEVARVVAAPKSPLLDSGHEDVKLSCDVNGGVIKKGPTTMLCTLGSHRLFHVAFDDNGRANLVATYYEGMDLSDAYALARNNNLELVSDNVHNGRRRLMFRSVRLYVTFEMYDLGLVVTYQHE